MNLINSKAIRRKIKSSRSGGLRLVKSDSMIKAYREFSVQFILKRKAKAWGSIMVLGGLCSMEIKTRRRLTARDCLSKTLFK